MVVIFSLLALPSIPKFILPYSKINIYFSVNRVVLSVSNMNVDSPAVSYYFCVSTYGNGI